MIQGIYCVLFYWMESGGRRWFAILVL